ncbi:MAG: hypothetical protein ABF649_22790 [Bacillus sp. (in: firmicutes)]
MLTQVTAASVVGYFGKNVKKFSEQLIEDNSTHFVASEALIIRIIGLLS